MNVKQILWRAHQAIAWIDKGINAQLNIILHHLHFQQLEASWRGLFYLTQQIPLSQSAFKLKLLNISWQDLAIDFSRAADFEHSQLFMKVYHQEFGHPGGEPFGLLMGDYYLSHSRNSDDLQVLADIAKVAAVAFCPFICAAHPSLLGGTSFCELERPIDLERLFLQTQYQAWQKLRAAEEVRFIGLVLPKILMRLPYSKHGSRNYLCYFEEDSSKLENYLWGNASYSFAAVVIRSFNDTGWFADIYGVNNGVLAKGLVGDLKRHHFSTDKCTGIYKYATDVCITERQEKQLCDAGFIALAQCKYSEFCAFYSCVSIQKLTTYGQTVATKNAYISSLLSYLLCVCRFAHFIKIIARDKIGTFMTTLACEQYLQAWLRQYTATVQNLSPELKAKYPLKEACVQVQELAGKPGSFLCIMHISPQLQFEHLEFNLQLTLELVRH